MAAALAFVSLLLVHLLQLVERSHFSSLAMTSVMLSAIYGGRGPALLDTAITAVGIDLLFSEPLFRAFDSWVSAVDMVVYAAVGLLTAEIVARLRDAYRDLAAKHAEAVSANRAREQVLGIVSHDLRSPLSAVLMAVALIRHTSHGPQREAAERAERAARQMSRQIEDLLDAVRIERGQFRVEPAMSDLVPALQDAIDGALAAAQSKAVQLLLEVPAAQHFAHVDRGRLTQVVANLVGNAVKFSPQGGVVNVSLLDDAAGLHVSVSDCGPGIPEAEIPHLFERRWQAGTTAHQGTGLGLFISASIVAAHGGAIEVSSRPGGGSVFTVHLPREDGDRAAARLSAMKAG